MRAMRTLVFPVFYVTWLATTAFAAPDDAQPNAVSPDGKLNAVGAAESVKVFNAANGNLIMTLAGHKGKVSALAFSPDGKSILSGSKDKTLRLWDLVTGKMVLALNGHESGIVSVSFSADGATITSTDVNKKTKKWRTATGESLP